MAVGMNGGPSGSPARGAMRSVPGAPGPARPLGTSFLPEAVRLFAALAGIGAGALTLGLSSNLLASALQFAAGGGAGWMPALPALPGFAAAAVVATAAVLLLLWAVKSLRGDTLAWQLPVRRVLPLAVALQLTLLVLGLWQLPVSGRRFDLTLACTIVLELAILACAGWLHRRNAPGASVRNAVGAPGSGGAGATRILASMFASAVLVSAVATAGLAASTAGHFAVPHGEHGAHQHSNLEPAPDQQRPVLHDPAQHHH
jgi:hypothetical protein